MIFQTRLARLRRLEMDVEANVGTGAVIIFAIIIVFVNIIIFVIIVINFVIIIIIFILETNISTSNKLILLKPTPCMGPPLKQILKIIMFSPRGEDGGGSKRRRNTKTNSSGLDVLSDGYCWLCHREGDVICCEACPRSYPQP